MRSTENRVSEQCRKIVAALERICLCFCVISLFCSGVHAIQRNDTIMVKLTQVMSNKERYIAIKEQNIEKIKQILTIQHLLPRQQYEIHQKLYDEYLKYCADSAIVYIRKNRDIAYQLNDKEMLDETAIQLAGLYSATGLYIEASGLLRGIDRDSLSARLLPVYFRTYSDFFSHYGQSNSHETYYTQSGLYRDSLLLSLDTRSFQYRLENAAKQVYTIYNLDQERYLLYLLHEAGSSPDRAFVAWLLGFMYQQTGNIELCQKYYAMSVISDIEHCIRDNASLQSLALVYFEQGEIASAYRYIHFAIEDALFCNVRYRISEASNFYPLINATYQNQAKKHMTRLYASLIVISILFIILTISLTVFYRQNHRLSRMRVELSLVNQKLNVLNHQLTSTNSSLQESNLVKEEYITHFFDVCSAYVDKLETYRRLLNKHAKHQRIDEMLKILDYDVIKRELGELYKKFDTIFLNLYPTFVEDFNAARTENSKIVLKYGELMNTELRIFALIRLGINNSVKIASFLRYSISTIYNYRVKARKYCNADKKTFEELVMNMGKHD